MSITSKSPRKVARAALRVAQAELSDFGHPNSPQTYTRPQLVACLVLKTFFRTDYRGIVAILALPGIDRRDRHLRAGESAVADLVEHAYRQAVDADLLAVDVRHVVVVDLAGRPDGLDGRLAPDTPRALSVRDRRQSRQCDGLAISGGQRRP